MGKGIGAHLLWENDEVVGIDFGNGSAEHEFGIKPLKQAFDVGDEHIAGVIPQFFIRSGLEEVDGELHKCLLVLFDTYNTAMFENFSENDFLLTDDIQALAKKFHINVEPKHEIETDWDSHSFGFLCFDRNADKTEEFLRSLHPGTTKIGVGSHIFPEIPHAGFVIKRL